MGHHFATLNSAHKAGQIRCVEHHRYVGDRNLSDTRLLSPALQLATASDAKFKIYSHDRQIPVFSSV